MGCALNTANQAFCNASPFCLRDLTSRPTAQKLKTDFEAYLDGFSPNVQEILDKFKFRNQIDTMIEADILGAVIQKFVSKDINLSPKQNGNLPGLDNHAMGTIFEELVRRFNEANNEEAGEHWTPRDVVELMADLVFAPIADQIKDATYGAIAISSFDGMCTPVVHVCTSKEEKRFVAYYLKMMAYTKVFKAISNGVRQNTSDFRSWDKVGDLLICLPSYDEQVAIADKLDELTQKTKEGISCFEQQISMLTDLRTRLISDVVTGQVDVRGIEVPENEFIEDITDENEDEQEGETDEE